MRFTRGDVRGPYRFIQNRSRISVVALKSDAAAENPKDQLSRDFLGCSIFDFCNNIGTKRTCRSPNRMSAFGVPAQPVDATQVLNLSAGVSNCKVSRGRSFS